MSYRPSLVFAFAALALGSLSLGACATAPRTVAYSEPAPMYSPPPPPPEQVEILAELPANAPPGECYAKVVVPGQPVSGPPQAQGARWVQSAGPPGSPGPIWCLIPADPVYQPVAFEPERYGYIRVLCETELTTQRVTGIQRKLHDGGYYSGAYTGQYDASTAQAVTRFQSARHIQHGGYLSVDTVRALDTVVIAPQITVSPQITIQQPYPQQPVYQRPVYAPPIYAEPIYQQPQAVYGGGYSSYQSYQGGYQGGYPAAAVATATAGRGGASAAAAASAGSYGYGAQAGYPPQGPGYAQGYNANYYGTSGYAGYGQGFWSGPGNPVSVGGAPPLPYPLPYDNYGPGPAAWPAPGFGPQGYPRPAYAAPTSAVQGGWLNWSGKSYF